MKNKFTLLALALPFCAFAQIDVTGTINDKANEKLGNTIDNVWSAPGKMRDKKKQQQQQQDSAKAASSSNANQGSTSTGNNGNTTSTGNNTSTNTTTATTDVPSIKTYQNYDFVPGTDLVFDDNFTEDQDGEFPSHWDLDKGQGVVNKVGDKPAFFLTDGNYVVVFPTIKSQNYLSNSFSVESDIYFSGGDFGLIAFFYTGNDDKMDIHINQNEANASFPNGENDGGNKSLSAQYPSDMNGENFINKWHHLAIAYKDNQVKVYVDQNRVLVIPNCHCQPNSVKFGGIGSNDNPIKFTNVRIANGANMNMLNKVMTDGKIITYGITFDVNKSDIRPESMGTINQIYNLMKDNPTLKFEIGGHTDSDGDPASNMKLSQARADAVRNQLISMGIDASRLTAKGYGATKPVADNNTFEGKAKNRRVEFTKTN